MLSELDPAAAGILDRVYEQCMELAPSLRRRYSIRFEPEERDAVGDFAFHMDNLVRLGLTRSSSLGEETYEAMGLTEFGRAFVRACRPPNTPDPAIVWSDVEALEAAIRQRQEAQAEAAARRAVEPLRRSIRVANEQAEPS